MSRMATLSLRVLEAIDGIDREAWNRLLEVRANPFVRWEWLRAMEQSGCASPRSGWTPHHLTLWRGRELIAAAPAYVKDGSDGDFARDWDIASGASGARLRYYPKLAITSPFTPCGGERILVAPGEDEGELRGAILRGAEEICEREKLGTAQILFADPDEARALAEQGWALRISHQYHWHNRGDASMEAYLARMNSKRRSMLKREMAQPAKEGISIRTIRGDELKRDWKKWAKLAHALHEHTVDKLVWGRRWLNQKFYLHAFESMPEAMELVVAEREGKPIAGAFNVSTPTRLFGRYWGCFEEHPFLHFNVCLYHSIADCIARGFEPSETYSLHHAADPRLDDAFQRHFAAETAERHAAIERFRRESGVFKNPDDRGAPAAASEEPA